MKPTRPSVPLLVWSVPIAVLVVIASLAGLADTGVYARETANWTLQAKGQDVGNLLAVVALLGAALRHRTGSSRAGLVWLGTLLYLVYAYVVYAMAVHFNALFLVYVTVLGLSCYAAMFSLAALRAEAVPQQPQGRLLAGWTLVATGGLFSLLWLSEVVPGVLSGEPPATLREAGLWVNPIHVLDLALVLPAFILTGVGALRARRDPLWWVTPWLVFCVLMGASIVAAMVMMMQAGFVGTLPATVMVSAVVVVSAVALGRYRLSSAPATTSGRMSTVAGR